MTDHLLAARVLALSAGTAVLAARHRVRKAAPAPLYVCRPVVNGAAILRWAAGAKVPTSVKAPDLHVTIAHSSAAVDWHAMQTDMWQDADGRIKIPAGGPRTLELLGNGKALVLRFSSYALQSRHRELREAGASWDWPGYHPHITLSYDSGLDPDAVARMPAYTGPIVLGPEKFEHLLTDDEKRAKGLKA